MTKNSNGRADDGPLSLEKRGTITAGALVLGTGAIAGTTAAQDDEEVVVFGDDYVAGTNFDVVAELEQQTTSNVVQSATEGTGQTAFEDPEDWDAYVIRYDVGDDLGVLGLLFAEEVDLSAGDSETMGEEGSFRNSALNLVETELD